jgi:hypothetical protein
MMNEYFGCDNVGELNGELKQYVGWVCKIDEKNGSKTVGNFTTGNYIHEFSIISSKTKLKLLHQVVNYLDQFPVEMS